MSDRLFFRVCVYAVRERDAARQAEMRSRAIVAALPRASERLGARAQRVMVDGSLRLNLEILEEAGLVVVRVVRPHGDRFTVDLVGPEREYWAVQGALPQTVVQARLL